MANTTSHGLSGPTLSTSAASSIRQTRKPRWTLGIMRDSETDEVPGSVLLLSNDSTHNAPLGMRHTPRRQSASSLPSPYPSADSHSDANNSERVSAADKKRTANGKIILDPQPEESKNDPLNWSTIRRDAALISLGLYCMVGGGMTPILAAGFTNVAATYDVTVPQVALTTGLYMMGLGVGSVIMSPTAIIFGKRPVYLATACLFILTSVWGALSPSYASLVVARVVQGIAVSPVECLPSATIAEIFFLHERAYRLGVYTLLLLGGKNLVPLVSAAIIQSLSWEWVFWIVAIVVGFCGTLLFLFVPETFWDRTPRPRQHSRLHRPSLSGLRHFSSHNQWKHEKRTASPRGVEEDDSPSVDTGTDHENRITSPTSPSTRVHSKKAHFAETDNHAEKASEEEDEQQTTTEQNPNSPQPGGAPFTDISLQPTVETSPDPSMTLTDTKAKVPPQYTNFYREAPPKSFLHTLRPYSGRLSHDNWFRIAARPFILFAYPSVVWSTAVYSLSVGWLIVLSESVTTIYRSRSSYNFTALQTGLIYISPFVGGILGTAVAGKLSDKVVHWMTQRNGGLYEPEFRLVMAIPVAIATTIGLMGYGWSAQEHDAWIVPTVFFGIISFGCSLGSTTAITFVVDSYRQYAGEALVTLNFSKNIFHGLVFSLFFNNWLDADGSRTVFLALGGIQLGVLLFSIPMYIYGKRCRMWTVRRNFMEKF